MHGVTWAKLEWWGCALALFLYTGAVFPMIFLADRGGLDEAAMAQLRLLALPTYAITLALLARHLPALLVALRRNLLFVFLIALPFVSTLWSLTGMISLRRAIALALSVALAYLLAIRFSPHAIIRLVATALAPVMVLSLLAWIVLPHLALMPEDGSLRGVHVHKNVLGWQAFIAVLVSIAMARQGASRLRVLIILVPSMICLALANSVTSLSALAIAALITPIYLLIARLGNPARSFVLLVCLQAFVFLLYSIDAVLPPLLETLGRDATLTGRIPLWEMVDAQIVRNPLLGFGYKSFWTSGNIELWHIWGQLGWSAPNAHNGYREVLLDLGLLGFVPLVLVLARALWQGAMLHCAQPREGWIALNVLLCTYLVMNMTESLFLEQNDFIFILVATAIIKFSLHAPGIRASREALSSPASRQVEAAA